MGTSKLDNPWTDGMIQKLRDLWAEEHSTSEIGRRMGISKSAVVGKAHRLGLPPRPDPIKRGDAPKAGKPHRRVRQDEHTGHKPLPAGACASLIEVRQDEPPPLAPSSTPEVSNSATFEGAEQQEDSTPPEQASPVTRRPTNRGEPLPAGECLPAPPAPEPPPSPTIAPAAQPTTKPASGCCWPLWGHQERPTHRYCDEPVHIRLDAEGRPVRTSYCLTHYALAYARPVARGIVAPLPDVLAWAGERGIYLGDLQTKPGLVLERINRARAEAGEPTFSVQRLAAQVAEVVL